MVDLAQICVAGASDAGMRRSINEDAFLITPESACFAVADGVGGAAAGEVASQLFISHVAKLITTSVCPDNEAAAIVKQIFFRANREILNQAKINQEQSGMACTAELLLLHDSGFTLGHVGDSRTYRYRDRNLVLLTKDHSLVQEQLDRGTISEKAIPEHRYRNVILRAVGSEETIDVDLVRGSTKKGDTFLLCSDGLTDMVKEQDIATCLHTLAGLQNKVDLLVALANKAGGRDNITVILVELQ